LASPASSFALPSASLVVSLPLMPTVSFTFCEAFSANNPRVALASLSMGSYTGYVPPVSIPLTAASDTVRSAFLSVSLAASMGPFWARRVIEKHR
jgi:hypothetical protein